MDGRLEKFLVGFFGSAFLIVLCVALVCLGFWMASKSPLLGFAAVCIVVCAGAGLTNALSKTKGDE